MVFCASSGFKGSDTWQQKLVSIPVVADKWAAVDYQIGEWNEACRYEEETFPTSRQVKAYCSIWNIHSIRILLIGKNLSTFDCVNPAGKKFVDRTCIEEIKHAVFFGKTGCWISKYFIKETFFLALSLNPGFKTEVSFAESSIVLCFILKN